MLHFLKICVVFQSRELIAFYIQKYEINFLHFQRLLRNITNITPFSRKQSVQD